MTKTSIAYSIHHPRILIAGLGGPKRFSVSPMTAAARRAAEGPHRADPDRLPRWG